MTSTEPHPGPPRPTPQRQAVLDALGSVADFRSAQEVLEILVAEVAIEPGGMDPCELRQAKGDAAVRDLVARRE